MTKSKQTALKNEEEHQGPIWTHPYMVYVLLTCILFGGLVFLGWLAIKNGWIPDRGTVN